MEYMRNTRNTVFAVLSLLVIFTLLSCDDHRPEDTTLRVGMVFTKDGDVLPYTECEQQGKAPLAVVFYVDREGEAEGLAYAVSLYDTPSVSFSDTLVSYGTSVSMTAFDGFSNSYALRSKGIVSPLVLNVSPPFFVPSVAQLRALYAVRPVVNMVIGQCGGDFIPDGDEWYWSSSEVDGQTIDRAWLYALSSGQPEPAHKFERHPTRPILTVYQYNRN